MFGKKDQNKGKKTDGFFKKASNHAKIGGLLVSSTMAASKGETDHIKMFSQNQEIRQERMKEKSKKKF